MSRSIWPKTAPRFVAQALSGHMAIGVAISALLYIICLSGTLLVFNQELQRWEQPGAPEMAALSPDAAQAGARAVLESESEPSAHLFIRLPDSEFPRAIVSTDSSTIFLDADGSPAGEEAFPWTQFIIDMHYYLHLPATLGLTVVGLLGVMLLAMALTGFFAHPRIFRDAFSFRFFRGRLTQADLHNRLSVWTAPFHIAVAATGAILGLASIAAFAIAMANFDGDTGAVFEPVFGAEPEPDQAPAQLANISGALDFMEAEHPDLNPTYVILHDPGTAGQFLQVMAEHPDRVIFGEYYNFNADGVFQRTAGMADGEIGQQVAGSLYQVHFGSFGGLPVKLAYVVLGLGLTVIVASGLRIYFMKREERGRPARRLDSAWSATLWGAPAAIAAASLARSFAGLEDDALTAVFWGIMALTIIAAMIRPDRESVSKIARGISGAAIIAAAGAHWALNASDFTAPPAIWLTVIFILTGAGLIAFIPDRTTAALSRLVPDGRA